jgi:hypothetical protein
MDGVISVRDGLTNQLPASREYSIQKLVAVLLFSLVIGTAAFLILVGPRALQPDNIAWLNNTDAMFQYLAWKFFAHTPWGIPSGRAQTT